MKSLLLTFSLCLLVTEQIRADLITFDDIPANELYQSAGMVPNGYGGLGWDNFYVSGNQAVVVPDGHFGTGGTPFTLNSAYLSGSIPMQGYSLQIETIGMYQGTVKYDVIYTLVPSTPVFCIFNYFGVDTVFFRAPGAVNQYPAVNFAIDNIEINDAAAVPEPAAFLPVAILLLPLVASLFYRWPRSRQIG